MRIANDGAAASEVLVRSERSLRTIVLNRPEALNALTLEMIRTIATLLDSFERDASVGYVAIVGAGERGLCAGGDIRTLYRSCLDQDGWAETFWSEEYALNARIASYPKPCIALMDGIVMGGGIGLSAHARHRIVTERSRLAMPEVGIGLIPDVGGTWLLSRAPGEIGTCLALTGMTVGAADAIDAGLADYLIPSSRLEELESAIATWASESKSASLARLFQAIEDRPQAQLLEPHRDLIDEAFSADSVEEIEARLAAADEAYAEELLGFMRTRSPTSLKVTLKLLRLARNANSLEDCLEREFTAILECARRPDSVEGVRAAVIDKDRNPQWRPAHLADVSDADVAAHFLPRPRKPIPFRSREKIT